MKNVSLAYSKFILEKVSFDNMLFEKELRKALKNLSSSEVRELLIWIRDRFANSSVISILEKLEK